MARIRDPKGVTPAAVAATVQLSDDEVKALAVRLLDYTRGLCKLRGWREGHLALARGSGAEDVARQALLTLFTEVGKRRWDPVKYPDPWKYLVGVARSYVSGLVGSTDRRLLRPDSDPVHHTDADDEEDRDGWSTITGEVPRAWLPTTTAAPDELLEEAEEGVWVQRAEELLLDSIADDRELASLHDAIEREGTEKPSVIAKALGKTTPEVKNMKKRLKRVFDDVVAQVRRELGEGGEA